MTCAIDAVGSPYGLDRMAHGPPIREAGSDGMRQAQPSNGLAAAADLQLLQDVVHVVLDRSDADREAAP